MLSFKTILLITLALFGGAQAVIRPGTCPTDVTVKTDFQLNDYLGVWYEIQRYEAEFQVSLDCVTAEYSLADPNVVRLTVVNGGYLFNETTQTPFEVRGVAIPSFPEDTTGVAKFSVAFFGLEPDRSNYWVLGSDYVNYSVVWSCEQISENQYQEFAWVLSRTRQMSAENYAKVYAILAANNVQLDDFRFTDQTDRCYGEIVPF